MVRSIVATPIALILWGCGVGAGCGGGGQRGPLGAACGADEECGSGACLAGECLSPAGDEDGDGIVNQVEVALGTNLHDADTDGDGLGDRAEVAADFSALDEDGDGDNDALESALADGDGDCVPDQKDAAPTSREAVIAAVCRAAGVCAGGGLAFTCDKGPVCDYAAVAGYEASETRCDGRDNDCDGATDEAPEVVCAPVEPAITVAPDHLALVVGETATITVTATFPDRTLDYSATTRWVPRDPTIVSVEAGVVTALAVGDTVLDAQIGPAARPSLPVHVGAAPVVLSSIALTPSAPSLPLGLGLTLVARGTFSDGHEEDLAGLTWQSDRPAVATVDEAGVVRSHALGSATIRARSGAIEGAAVVTVGAPIPVGLDVATDDTRLPFDGVLTLRAFATLSDGGDDDVSGAVDWRSSDVTRATVDAAGLVTGHAPGEVVITAALEELEATVSLRVVVTRSPLVVATALHALRPAPAALTVVSPAARVVASGARLGGTAPIVARPIIRANPP